MRIVARAARVLGKYKEARFYDRLARQIKEAFNRTFYDPAEASIRPGQASSATLFRYSSGWFRFRAAARAATDTGFRSTKTAGHFDVGVLGAKYLIDALTEHGRPDAAYALAVQPVPELGTHARRRSTTLSEFWDLHGSHNHVMMGSPSTAG